MQEGITNWIDYRSEEYLDGYIAAMEIKGEMWFTVYCDEDELYCIQRSATMWEMIDTPTAVEWGL